ncbi:PREDICTED: phytosulfokines 2-like [Tarenaya hassleriana]|uniref:phytosulfokines 2-like n=1 Tax=Tarenaya hassleriana TaxID=28532 RepID=UPI00053C1025|nr:PREDICTED: phytosulfokines 2-like [Tarenaya hassleriana]
MANLSALLTLALLVCSALMCAARPEPALTATTSLVNKLQLEKTGANADDVAEESCGGEDEDCLIRRTLAAHLDYIYTQREHRH